jgi:hypothetical protein
LIALKDFLQKISALLPAKITESFRTSKLRRRRLGKKWSGNSLKRAVRISQNAATFHLSKKGSREWGVGSGECHPQRLVRPSPFPTPHSLLPIFRRALLPPSTQTIITQNQNHLPFFTVRCGGKSQSLIGGIYEL